MVTESAVAVVTVPQTGRPCAAAAGRSGSAENALVVQRRYRSTISFRLVDGIEVPFSV
jgi:hypothetical protein